jgi:hypothetical protein
MRRLVRTSLLMLLLLSLMPATMVWGQSIGVTVGEITVYNESGFEVTIYISGNEVGKLDPGYSRTYKVPLGSHRVEARTDSRYGKSGYIDFNLTGTYPYDQWYIKNHDLN